MYKRINKRFDTIEQYREEIERASVIINGTESEAARIRMRRYRMRLEKELFSLMEEQHEQITKEI